MAYSKRVATAVLSATVGGLGLYLLFHQPSRYTLGNTDASDRRLVGNLHDEQRSTTSSFEQTLDAGVRGAPGQAREVTSAREKVVGDVTASGQEHFNLDVLHELELSPLQVDQLLPVLRAQDGHIEGMRVDRRPRSPETGLPLPVRPAELDAMQQGTAEVNNILGPEKAAQFWRLQRGRGEISRVRGVLSSTSEPLTARQAREFFTRVREDVDDHAPSEPGESIASRADRRARLRTLLEGVLSPQQRATLAAQASSGVQAGSRATPY